MTTKKIGDMLKILKLVRPEQYIKNFFVLLPLFFAGRVTDLQQLLNVFLAFVAFCLSASAVYILNDWLDIEEDRLHSIKKHRPLASGAVSPGRAGVLAFVLLLAGGFLMGALSPQALMVLLVYVTLNIFYSIYLKHIAILDVTIIAIGFVLRLFVGSLVVSIHLSMWIVTMTFLLALFIALAKRRDDVLIFNTTGKKMRKVIDGYNLRFIDSSMTVMASVVIVAYLLYATSGDAARRMHSESVYLTAIFVIMGIMRYLQIIFVEERSGSPTLIVLSDRFMQLTILSWFAFFVWIIYFDNF